MPVLVVLGLGPEVGVEDVAAAPAAEDVEVSELLLEPASPEPAPPESPPSEPTLSEESDMPSIFASTGLVSFDSEAAEPEPVGMVIPDAVLGGAAPVTVTQTISQDSSSLSFARIASAETAARSEKYASKFFMLTCASG